MKKLITCCLTIPRDDAEGSEGDHDLEDGFHFGFDGENLHYVVTYEVG